MLLVRTNPEAPKHQGITCLLVDMKSPGIEVRPLRMMSGDSGFNEVFFTGVRVPAANVLGHRDEGWTTAMVALSNERANLGTALYVVFRRGLDALGARARTTERLGRSLAADPLVRQKLAQAEIELEVFRLCTLRSITRMAHAGDAPPEGSILKLLWTEMNQRLAQTALEVLGPEALQWDCDGGRWAYQYLRSRGNTIEAGTSEVQRNIIARRVLGLPRSY
jgi:alkylation response protein AidB-like acyl-CoA dehydrogenase